MNSKRKNIIIFLSIVLLIIVLNGCSTAPRFTGSFKDKDSSVESIKKPKQEPKGKYSVLFVQEGLASFYADQFHGKKTANGEIFDMNKFSAAHRTAPLGSIAVVTNLKNNKTVRVRINDRGPFIGGRILDLSKRAAEELDFIKDGVTKIRLEVIKFNNE